MCLENAIWSSVVLETEKEDSVSGVKEMTQVFMWYLAAVRKTCLVKTHNEERSLGVHERVWGEKD